MESGSSVFISMLRDDTAARPKRWLCLLYDQLNLELNPWKDEPPESTGIILIESLSKGKSRPFHKQKLGLILANMRSFALESQSKGHPVKYIGTNSNYSEALLELKISLIHCLKPAELSTRKELQPLFDSGKLQQHPHTGWLTPKNWFVEELGLTPPFRMDKFYRRFRKETGILMDGKAPVGGKYSFDSENRMTWKGQPIAPEEPTFEVTDLDREVEELVNTVFSDNPGKIDLSKIPTNHSQALEALDFAMLHLPNFGPYEDAMSTQSKGLFHSRLASLVNIHRIMPAYLLESVLRTPAPMNSTEGFVRQLIWREYVKHVHDITDGFENITVNRTLTEVRDAMWYGGGFSAPLPGKNRHPNHLTQENNLPMAYWNADSGFNCLDTVVGSVIEDGWTHHIPRLMVLGNIASLLDVNPRQLTDWFHAAFIDAYDWVVEPNVLGMGTFALGESMMTKPYISGAAYINRMSDYCKECQYDPKKNCPITNLYWDFISRHSESFNGNHRMAIPLRNSLRRDEEKKNFDRHTFEAWSHQLCKST